MGMIEMNIIGIFMVLMLLLISLVILFACKPWRYLSRFRSSRFSTFKISIARNSWITWITYSKLRKNYIGRIFIKFFVYGNPFSAELGDLQRPLVSDDGNLLHGQTSEVAREFDLEGACYQNEGLIRSSLTEGRAYKQRLPSSSPIPTQGESFVLEVISEPSDDALLGQTLKLPAEKGPLTEVQTYDRQNKRSLNLKHDLGNDGVTEVPPRLVKDQRSWLFLEVTAGPSIGLQHTVHSASTSKLPVSLGRVATDLVLKDSEVSGKHAHITWNSSKLKWELVDLGSLNGTLLNSRSVSHPDSGSRKWGNPVELASEDIITLGTTTKVHVRILTHNEYQIPFRIAVASDPMAQRRGGKKLPMEDVCYYKWPLPGADKFGVFGVCDGHGGAGAAQSASKMIPEVLANILSDSLRREKVLSNRDASDVLRDVFAKTEASLDCQYEGCTATALLVWKDNEDNLFAQCANLGDSACVINFDGKYIQMTEDHRVTSVTERKRIQEAGLSIKDGETRLFGINLARMLGDKFPKGQDSRFSAEPYISQPIPIDQTRDAFALLASDGLWDVVSTKKAVQLVLQMREKESGTENRAEKIANGVLSEARAMRTKDNTSILYLDFDTCL